MSLIPDPANLDDPALLLTNHEQIEAFRALARKLDQGDGSLIWQCWETIIRARIRLDGLHHG
jgi:hypothetical protein